jgi:Ca2+-binding EF-hand superfamily protein
LGAALEEEVSALEASLRAKDLKITSLEGQLAELEGQAAGGGSHRLPGRGGLSQRAARAVAKQSDLLEVGEVAALHAEFAALAAASPDPSLLRREQFEAVLARRGVEWGCSDGASAHLHDRLFAALDTGRTGALDFREYALGMAAVCHGSARDKFQLSFDLFDVDGTGEIGREEMVAVLTMMDPLCQAARGGGGAASAVGLRDEAAAAVGSAAAVAAAAAAAAAAEARSAEIAAFVGRVFALADVTANGRLTLLEYMRATLHNPCLVELALA